MMRALWFTLIFLTGCSGSTSVNQIDPDTVGSDEVEMEEEQEEQEEEPGVEPEALESPVIAPFGGTFPETQLVTLTAPADAAIIRYTLDGSAPNDQSPVYTAPLALDGVVTLSAIASRDGFADSPVSQTQFVIGNTLPVWQAITPVAAMEGQSLTLTFQVSDADGAPPLISSNLDSLPGTPVFTDNQNGSALLSWDIPEGSQGTFTVPLTARDNRFPEISTTATAEIVVEPRILGTVAAPISSPEGGLFAEPTLIILQSETTDTVIFYTLDGSVPDRNALRYDVPFLLQDSATLRAVAVRDRYLDSGILTARFDIGNAAPVWMPVDAVSVTEGEGLLLPLSASDADGGFPLLSADLSALPGSATFEDQQNGQGLVSWTAPADSRGSYTLSATAQDDRFPDIERTISLTVQVLPADPDPEPEPEPVDADTFLQAFYADGKVVIEAENYLDARGSVSGQSWSLSSTLGGRPQLDAFGSGDVVMDLRPDTNSDTGEERLAEEAARLDYRILFDSPGEYYIWLRGTSESVQRQVYFGTEGVVAESASQVSGLSFGNWGWTNTRAGSSEPARLTVDRAGELTLNLWLPRSGLSVDKILLTPDPAFVPKGFGPQESAQGELPEYPVVADSHVFSWNFNVNPDDGTPITDQVRGRQLFCTDCPRQVSSAEQFALRFDGSQSLVTSNPVALDFAPGNGFAVEAVIRSTDNCNTAGRVVSRGNSVSGSEWYLGCEGDKVTAFVSDGPSGTSLKLVSNQSVDDGRWHAVALVYDAGFEELRLYVDGQEDQSGSLSLSTSVGAGNDLIIGATAGAGEANGFKGELDALALHDRSLRPDELERRAQQWQRSINRDLWACEAPVRIMPLGDSITAGSDRGGLTLWGTYRPSLYRALQLSGINADFVGSYTGRTANEPDRQHEGWPGINPNQVNGNIRDWLEMNPPEMILLHLGTNGVSDSTDEEINRLINTIQTALPEAPVVVGQIINRQTFDPATASFNDALAQRVQPRINAGERLYLVDHEPVLDYASDMVDNLHVSASGADKMAIVWLEALEESLPRCRPAPVALLARPEIIGRTGELLRFWPPVAGHPIGSFELTDAPAGMRINPETGEIRWASPSAGSFTIGVSVSNPEGSGSRNYQVRVN